MSNLYVGMYKDIVNNFYKKMNGITKVIKENNEKFSVEYAKEENELENAKAKQSYINAKNAINNVFEEVKGYLAIANFPNVEDLTADRLLFSKDTSIILSADEIGAYAERYKNNYTMLRLIKDWITINHDGLNDYTTLTIMIYMPNDILEVYKKFAESALGLIDSIYTGNASEASVTAYAEENFGASLYAVIGNGMELHDYKNKRVPESAKHCFDNITLLLDNTRFNFIK